MFCKHRWTNVKRWVEDKELRIIQRCRWCNRWLRKNVPLSLDASEITTLHYLEKNAGQKNSGLTETAEGSSETETAMMEREAREYGD